MSSLPARPPAQGPPLPAGWTEHKAPSGHTYYYNKETKKSTYTRPIAEISQIQRPPPDHTPPAFLGHASSDAPLDLSRAPQPVEDSFNPQKQIQDLIFSSAPQQFPQQHGGQQHGRGVHRSGFRGGQSSVSERRREKDDKPKHRQDIPHCVPWVLVKTRFGRRFVWNKETNESFWKFPQDVMLAVVEFDRKEREKKERRERGEPSDVEENDAMAEIEAELAAAEEEVEIVEIDGEAGMEDEEEYEEVEVTDDEGEDVTNAPKRQRTDDPGVQPPADTEDDDLAWQLAQMEAMEAGAEEGEEEEYCDDDPILSKEDCKTLFKELLDDTRISPYTPWDKILDDGVLYDDDRYKALPNMAARKECFNEWARDKMQYLKEEKAKQQKRDPKIPYLALLDRHATPKLYWPEFRRKYKKEPEMKEGKISDKDKEKLYRDHIKRLGMRSSDLKSDLSTLLRTQPLASLNRSTSIDTLPSAVLTDLRYISLPPSTRNSLIETYISTLPSAPEGAALSAEEEVERAKKAVERERRENALADRERRVREEKRRQERDLAYGKGRLREEEQEIERAMRVGKEGLRGQLDA